MLHGRKCLFLRDDVMKRVVLLLLLMAGPVMAQPGGARDSVTVHGAAEPEWRQASEQPVLVTLNRFEPAEIRLVAGQPTRLVFYNNTRAAMSLDAGDFFRAARVRSGDERNLVDGGMTLRPGETRAVTLVPAEGRYRVRSGNWLRRLLGMSALIVVEPAR
jgi:hypothetical protein